MKSSYNFFSFILLIAAIFCLSVCGNGTVDGGFIVDDPLLPPQPESY